MSKTAFLFTGQGSQAIGMSKELNELFPRTNSIYECGSDVLGFDLKKLMFEGDEAALSVNSQPAILAGSLVALTAARELGIDGGGVAGHSLGEYAALYASGMVTMENAFRLIKLRAAAMATVADGGNGGDSGGKMAAVIGAPASVVEEVCAAVRSGGKYVVPVNYNSPVQTVIAGTADALAAAEPLLKEKKAKRVVYLNVTAAFHSDLMKPAAEKFKADIAGFTFEKPNIKFYANLYGKELTDFSDIHSYLSAHICSPVLFTSEFEAIRADGFDTFVECGGKVLTGLVKKTLDGVNAYSVSDGKDFAELKAQIVVRK